MSHVERLASFLRTQSRSCVFIEALGLAIVVGFIDYLTGYEVTVWPFYSIPILLMIWFGDRNLAVLFSVLSIFAWWWVDKASGHLYSSEWLRVWDAIVRLMFSCLAVVIALEATNDMISLRVSDDGIGFDPSGPQGEGWD
jgi:hypothetical protein